MNLVIEMLIKEVESGDTPFSLVSYEDYSLHVQRLFLKQLLMAIISPGTSPCMNLRYHLHLGVGTKKRWEFGVIIHLGKPDYWSK